MSDKIHITHGDHEHHNQIVIKIDLEEVFHKRQCHPEEHDPGTVVYYIIRVDKKQFELKEHELTGKQILALVGYSPDKYRLFELGEGQREIRPDETVDFRKCGVERFKSVAKHANEGIGAAIEAAPSFVQRKAVELLAEDEMFLNRNYQQWETIKQGSTAWILLHHFKIPQGYNVHETTVAFMIPPSYPTVEFDMMYFYPALSRNDHKGIGALESQSLDGKTFQRWSRHRNSGEWRPEIDNLETHVLSVQAWLLDELKK